MESLLPKRKKKKGHAAKKPARPYVAPEKIEPVSVERAIDEGLLIARAALTMEVKNHIIVTSLRDNLPYDPDEVTAFVRSAIENMSLNYLADRRQMDRLAIASISAEGPQTSGHDYRSEDYEMLSQRGKVFSGMSRELDRLVADDDYVQQIALAARDKAWAEIGATIETRLDWILHPPVTESNYELVREKRMRQLKRLDLGEFAPEP